MQQIEVIVNYKHSGLENMEKTKNTKTYNEYQRTKNVFDVFDVLHLLYFLCPGSAALPRHTAGGFPGRPNRRKCNKNNAFWQSYNNTTN